MSTADKVADATTGDDDGYEEYEEAPVETKVSVFKWSLRAMPAWLVSLVVHLALLLLLGICTFANLDEAKKVFVDVVQADPEEEAPFELTEAEIEPPEDLEEFQEVSLEAQAFDPGAIAFGDLGAVSDVVATDTVGTISLAETTIDEIGALFGEDGSGMADIGDGLKAAANFFGTKAEGNRFVFVVDNSNSMGRGRFETALNEMVRVVNGFGPRQMFYVIFFSDTGYRLFHPNPAPGMVAATESNKEKLRAWLYTVEMVLRTDGLEAMKAAFALNPDVIYILGDGAFTDKTGEMLTAPHNRRIPIHTVGMEVNERGEKELQAIAAANNGTYRLVRASPEAMQMAKRNPIKRNNKRGPVWGVKLPAK